VSPLNHVNPTAGNHPHDELAAYTLDAVDGDERRMIESHLAVCPLCRREVAAHQEVLSQMIADESPPAGVWDKIAQETQPRGRPQQIQAETQTPAETPADTPAETPAETPARQPRADDLVQLTTRRPPRHLRTAERARSRRLVVGALAAAAAVVVAVGVGPRVWDNLTGDESPPTTLAAPDLPVGDITAANGTTVAYVRADDRGSYIEMADQMATLPSDRTYQLWSLDAPDPVSLGLLGTGTDPTVRVSLPEGTTRVAISDEPAGGSPAPTGLIAGSGDLAVPA
jgi:anti-sigma-K factor RskA